MNYHSEFNFPIFFVEDCPAGRKTDFAVLKKVFEQRRGYLNLNQEMCLMAVCLAQVWKCTPAQMFEQYDFAQHYILALKECFEYSATQNRIADFLGCTRYKVQKTLYNIRDRSEKHKRAVALYEDCRMQIKHNNNIHFNGKG
jgi:hypothetical protein